MKHNPTALAMSLLAGAFLLNASLLNVSAANAQTNSSPPATATRPAKTPQEQSSVPNNAPPASRTQTTGETSQDPTIKDMNAREKGKVETKGK